MLLPTLRGRLPGWLLAASCLLPLLLLAGCAGNAPVMVGGEAAAMLNKDVHGKPLSMVVRVYQLKSDQAFNRLTMEALMAGKSDKDLLAPDLLSSQEMTLLPGAKAAIGGLTVAPEATYIGLVGMFRQPDRQFWRLLYKADDVRRVGLLFRAEDCYLRALIPPARPMPGQPATQQVDCR
ncbi:type VI secretion system lipoprotein TssJ [Vogesella sp. LIG4]|uniref:type VI secretion system lipoprotein TssJ n=1 Tax=Vogesella sp. LIG4 TaxID=1192162 RepID=UPI00081F9992|nr:type VI secretion system lipoprotein TssJ [Vogesella sp. LIG4]SCK08632.1 type VI secretion system protein VasD [Vogesella sp. LIG4]